MNKSKKAFLFRIILFSAFIIAGLCMIFSSVFSVFDKDKPGTVSPASSQQQENSSSPPPVKEQPWNLRLVNFQNPIGESLNIELQEFPGDQRVDSRIAKSLQQMLDDCTAQDFDPLICSSFRTREDQTTLFNRQVEGYLDDGDSREEAEAKAATAVAPPGTGEHELGLAVDIVSTDNQLLDESQVDNPCQQWLMQNSWRYGFILRYPKNKEELTGKMYEPWHYRYVGDEAAEAIYKSNLCLEEYLENIVA